LLLRHGRTAASFRVTQRLEGPVCIVEVEGELDLASVERVEQVVGPALEQRRRIVLDLSACPFIDSAGLRFVLHMHRLLTDKGQDNGALAVVVANDDLRRIFALAAIDQIVPVVAALDEAL
jgi:anti-sigma B factor antagonist